MDQNKDEKIDMLELCFYSSPFLTILPSSLQNVNKNRSHKVEVGKYLSDGGFYIV